MTMAMSPASQSCEHYTVDALHGGGWACQECGLHFSPRHPHRYEPETDERPDSPGVHLEVWRGHNGSLQVSISELDEKGAGGGYRLYGPKFCGCCWRERVVDKVLDKRDAENLIRYAEAVL